MFAQRIGSPLACCCAQTLAISLPPKEDPASRHSLRSLLQNTTIEPPRPTHGKSNLRQERPASEKLQNHASPLLTVVGFLGVSNYALDRIQIRNPLLSGQSGFLRRVNRLPVASCWLRPLAQPDQIDMHLFELSRLEHS